MDTRLSRQLALLVALVAAAALASPAATSASAAASASASTRYVGAEPLASAVVREVNAVRWAHGLRRLAVRPPLVRAARSHAQDMARHRYFEHSWSTGAPFSRWIRRYWPGPGYRSTWSVGENLYWSGPTIAPAQVVGAWLRSRPHRANLLGRRWRAIGVGSAEMLSPAGAFAGVDRATVVAAEFGVRN